ncbi:MAG: YecA family protein, partial [Piscinibacter sp.]|uniref:YecA/YgfB family protein n=1 Tax=Piscinibacter sp. TaxID=1903157 RepID=UPI003D0D5960
MATHRPTPGAKPRPAAQQALTERDLEALQEALDRVPAPLEPLDVSALDGFLCGVLLQPRRVAEATWMPHVTDADGRAAPPGFDARPLQSLARRRHAELDAAIQARQWFDPWVFELDGEGDSPSDAVVGWVAGFATAMEFFPALMALDAQKLREPLALLYRHLDPDDLEDADDLIEEIESLVPPADLAEAVEDLVKATVLLADVSRPL